MKIKLIALAVAALVSGAANADIIDGGATSGNGGLLFAAWDGNTSFALNTGLTIDSLASTITSNLSGYTLSSAAWTNWLSTANAATVSFVIFANDQLGAQRGITTTDGNYVGGNMTNGNARVANASRTSFISNKYNLGDFSTAGVVSAVKPSSDAAYVGSSALAFGQSGYAYNFNSNGSLANNSYATGMGVISINTPNATTAASTYAVVGSGVIPARAWIGADQTFHIAAVTAVPEPETLAMLLAGIGMIGSIARRRNRA